MKKVLFEGKYRRFVNENGWEYTDRVNSGGIVAIVARTPEGKILFVEQHRAPVGRSVIELPAGLVSDCPQFANETMETAANRELLEETGYEAERMTFLAEGPASSAALSDVISLYYAEGLQKKGIGGGDETENITVHEVEESELDVWLAEMRNSGRYVDPKIFAGLYFLKQIENQSNKRR